MRCGSVSRKEWLFVSSSRARRLPRWVCSHAFDSQSSGCEDGVLGGLGRIARRQCVAESSLGPYSVRWTLWSVVHWRAGLDVESSATRLARVKD